MNNNASSKLSPIQIFTLCAASSALGTLCFAPFLKTGIDVSWAVAIVIATAFAAVTAVIYTKALGSPKSRISDTLGKDCVSRFIFRLVLFALALLFIAESALTAYITTDATEMYLLEETPNEVLLLVLLATVCTVFDAGRQYLARCCVILLLLTAIPLIIFVALSLFNIDFGELTALTQPNAASVIRQLPAAVLSCSGGAAAVILISGAQSNKTASSAVLGFSASGIVSLLLLICSVGVFNAKGIGIFKYPYIEMARSVSIGTITLTERFDTILLCVMLIAVIMQLSVFCYCASFCLSRAFGLHSHRCWSYLILPIVFSAAYYADIEIFFGFLSQTAFYAATAITLAAPVVVFALNIGKRRSKNA